AQTPGEINNNSGRLYEFETLEEVQENLNQLSEGDNPYVQQTARRPGQKEQRYVHLFGQVPETSESPTDKNSSNIQLEERVAFLEGEVLYLRENLDKLLKELLG